MSTSTGEATVGKTDKIIWIILTSHDVHNLMKNFPKNKLRKLFQQQAENFVGLPSQV